MNGDIEFIKTPRSPKLVLMAHSNDEITYRQYRIIDAIIEKTFGWHKRFDRATNTQIGVLIKLHPTHVSTEIKGLIQRKILIKQDGMIGLNINTSEWILEVSQNSKPLAKTANKSLAKTAKNNKPIQLNTKDTITKEKKDNKNILSEQVQTECEKPSPEPAKQDQIQSVFENIFWLAGMKKIGKPKALSAFKSQFKAWRKETGGTPEQFAAFLVGDIRSRLQAKIFGFENLHPTTYLNQKRWEDEKPATSTPAKPTSGQSGITVSKSGLVFLD
ncbi:replication protein [Xenorhabdus budapestensis]|uniref:Replication protein n=1 Tax=Xenorhabdus budapestensis TaxID=290110 RepID=A0ABX7VIK0_XENBU|nr:replication protein [Xenorhabdus budapestensis]QTL40574.1 replication protein [Xenorhabdus budapestensis]